LEEITTITAIPTTTPSFGREKVREKKEGR
jgi:hypothetical protein